MNRFRQDEARYWPYCMIEISNRKDSAEACGGPTSMPGVGEDWVLRLSEARARLAPTEIKAITRGPPGAAA